MPLVTSKEMLLDAQRGNYAVGAFNAENMLGFFSCILLKIWKW